MNRIRTRWAALIILVVLVIAFALSVPHTHDAVKKLPASELAATGTPQVWLHDAYKKGVHTLTGNVLAANPCTSVSAEATLTTTASNTPQISLSISAPADTGTCLQVPTLLPFTATITASSSLPLMVDVNGVVASTTLK